MAADLAEVQARLDDIRRFVESNSRRLDEAQQQLKKSEQAWRHQTEQEAAASRENAAKNQARRKKGIETNADEAHTQAVAIATRAIELSAPEYLAKDFADAAWQAMASPATGEWVRVGRLHEPDASLPLALPLSAGTWRVCTPDADTFRALVHNTLLRLLAAFDVPRVRTVSFDPDLTLDLGAFAAVRAVHRQSVPPPSTSAEDFERELASLVDELAAVHDRLTAAGHDSFWRALASGHPLAATTPLRVLVVASAPEQLSDRGAARLAQVRRLAAGCGLLVIEASSTDASSADRGLEISLSRQSATTTAVPGVTWVPDEWVGDRIVRARCAVLVDRPRQSLAPTVDFEKIVSEIGDAWMADSDEGLETTIGVIDGGDLIVRLRSENPPMPNALVGGAVGQGKSNLLLVLIHGLAARYSPAELEMVLVDLRDGVEFARLGPDSGSRTWLPHVRALGLEFDPDYSIAVLRWVGQQMTERSGLLKQASSTTLKQYRAVTGKTIPRLVVVIDEFQKLFEGDDDQIGQAASLLENIARTGRGFGVHLILASQAVSGIRGLAVKQDAIFGQFHNRITLKNIASESQAFLKAHNLAATELEHRGQVVVNDALGEPDRNTFGTVAFADESYLSRLRSQLFSQGHGAPPEVFRSSSFAVWKAETKGHRVHSGAGATVGLPIGVEQRPRAIALSRSPNQGLAVVGADRAVAIAVLSRAVVTTAAGLRHRPRVVILDGDSFGNAKPWVSALHSRLEREGAAVERVPRDAIATRLVELAAAKGSADLLVPVALDSVDLSSPVEPDYVMPNDSLRELLKTGPLSETWTIGWWQSKSVLDEHLGYRAPGVRAWALCGVSRDDLTDVCGHGVREPSSRPRFIWFDRNGGGAERLVPFDTADLLGGVSLG